MGFLVDEASEVLTIHQDAIDDSKVILGNSVGDYISGIAKVNNRVIVILELEKIISQAMWQEKYRKIKISFPDLDLDSYLPSRKALPVSLDANLFVLDNCVRLEVFCDEACDLYIKFNTYILIF